jgi:hypothetical protein
MNGSPERWLIASILAQAVRDARDGNGYAAEARRWLLESKRAEIFLDELGIHRDVVATWVNDLEPLLQPELPGICSSPGVVGLKSTQALIRR